MKDNKQLLEQGNERYLGVHVAKGLLQHEKSESGVNITTTQRKKHPSAVSSPPPSVRRNSRRNMYSDGF